MNPSVSGTFSRSGAYASACAVASPMISTVPTPCRKRSGVCRLMVNATRGLRRRFAKVVELCSTRKSRSNPSSAKKQVTHHGVASPAVATFITLFSASTFAIVPCRRSVSTAIVAASLHRRRGQLGRAAHDARLAVLQHHHVFDAHAAPAAEVDPRLDGEHHP